LRYPQEETVPNAAVADSIEEFQTEMGGFAAEYESAPRPTLARRTAPSKLAGGDREALLLRHLPQVYLVARGVWERVRFAVELDDLVGYGTIGLVRAIEKYDPARGILLKTYAEYRIRGAILDGLRGMDWLSRAARHAERREQQRETALANERCCGVAVAERDDAGTERRSPSGQQIRAVFSGGSLADLERLATLVDAPLFAPAPQSPERIYERRERNERLAQALARLPQRQQRIMDLYYRCELTMREIAEQLQLHESRISQLHGEALEALRRQLVELDGQRGRRYVSRLRAARTRQTACQSSAVSTPTVSCAVSAT
jgi:RNA polymerase sigma factor FliA